MLNVKNKYGLFVLLTAVVAERGVVCVMLMLVTPVIVVYVAWYTKPTPPLAEMSCNYIPVVVVDPIK